MKVLHKTKDKTGRGNYWGPSEEKFLKKAMITPVNMQSFDINSSDNCRVHRALIFWQLTKK